MRNVSWKLKALSLAGVAALFSGGAAQAAPITFEDLFGTNAAGQAVQFNYVNYDSGTLYSGVAPGSYDLTDPANSSINSLSAPGAVGNEDSWAIARVSTITVGGNTVWAAGLNNAPGNSITGAAPGEITVLIWGERDTFVDVGTNSLTTHGVGMQFAVYYDSSPDFFNPGIRPYTNRTGATTFTGITDGQLILTGRSTPGVVPGSPTAEFSSSVVINPSTGLVASGSGDAWGNWTSNDAGTGDFNDKFTSDSAPPFTAITPPHEFEVHFTVTPAPTVPAGWTAQSNDPLKTAIVPTPSALGMGVFGMVGLLASAYRRRARQAN